MKRILLIEDDPNIADGLVMNLDAEGYEVLHVDDGSLVMEQFNRGNFDLVLMDIMLPGVDGLTLCKMIRRTGSTVPILFVTARDRDDEKVEGLIAGGDDYIVKPFNMAELLARIQGIFRRLAWLGSEEQLGDVYEFDGRRIDFRSFAAEGPGGKFDLSRRECMVFKYLVERRGEVVSRDQLLDGVWGYHAFPTNRTIDNFILKLRKIFEDDPKKPKYLETIRGVGYRFKTD
jgi:two-component system alkaline phosphatase synthesis response regulator PhoP